MRYGGCVLAGLLVAAGLTLGPASLRAGEIEELARRAEGETQAGKHVEALDTLRQALMTLAGNVPLGFRRIAFIAEPPNGYGIYRPKPEAIFRTGEPLMIYVEPIGLGWRQEGEQFQARLTVDFELRSPEGQILTGQKEFGRFDFNSRERNFEIMTHLTLNVSGAPAGDYVFGATYHDKITGKSANFDLKFQVK